MGACRPILKVVSGLVERARRWGGVDGEGEWMERAKRWGVEVWGGGGWRGRMEGEVGGEVDLVSTQILGRSSGYPLDSVPSKKTQCSATCRRVDRTRRVCS
jgi:hypothetical protein